MTTYTQPRTASDPHEYVRQMQAKYDERGQDIRFRVVSIDGETKSGRKRYTLEVIDRTR